MKHASFIISHIRAQPSFEKLERIASYKKLLALLPPRYQNTVRFMYNKNNTLWFVLEHPGFKMEFHYKLTMIKGLLKELVKRDESCKCIDADEIKVFVTNKSQPLDEPLIASVPLYDERAKGGFEIKSRDEKLCAIFEEIREIICKQAR